MAFLREAYSDRPCSWSTSTSCAIYAFQTMYVDVDEAGWLRNAGPAAARARLAPDVHARTAELGPLRVRLLADLRPHQELLLWFDEHVLARADIPFLTLRNIRGKKNYVCHECGAQFEQPNPLKVHLFLSCREYSPLAFWRQFRSRLAAAHATPAAGGRPSAFRPYATSPPPLVHAASLDAPAQLEALAAEWGRSRNGHLCLYCGKLYSRKYGLKIHIRTHTGYKPLQCRYCLRAFGDPSNLNKHVRLHAATGAGAGAAGAAGAGAGEHACALCGKRLVRRRDLLRHLRARHADAVAASGPSHTKPCAVP
ncbi:PR/SET domain 13 [Aphomia sociella]